MAPLQNVDFPDMADAIPAPLPEQQPAFPTVKAQLALEDSWGDWSRPIPTETPRFSDSELRCLRALLMISLTSSS